MRRRAPRGFTLVELGVALGMVSVLLAVFLPALSSARVGSRRSLCAGNQRLLGQAWAACADDNEGRFPVVYAQPAWLYGGVRFSSVDETPFLDHSRPLNRYLPLHRLDAPGEMLFECPADRGITDASGEVGTGRRTAYRAFGTSYRANPALLEPMVRVADATKSGGDAGAAPGLARSAITTAPSRLVVMGDPVWHEVRESTGRVAEWHGRLDSGNMLFLDGSVRFVAITPAPAVGPAVFDPLAPQFMFPK